MKTIDNDENTVTYAFAPSYFGTSSESCSGEVDYIHMKYTDETNSLKCDLAENVGCDTELKVESYCSENDGDSTVLRMFLYDEDFPTTTVYIVTEEDKICSKFADIDLASNDAAIPKMVAFDVTI